MKKQNRHIGSDFDKFLAEEGILADAEAAAIKRVIAYQIAEAMGMLNVSKTEMAKKMRTSRASLDRLLDPANESITLHTLNRAALALGKKLKIEIG